MRVCRDESAGTKRLLDDVHELCTMHADRAHGLLVAAVVGPPTKPRPPDPTPEMLETPEFNAVWNVIKGWDVDHGGGMRSGATGNDARAILDALDALEPKLKPISGAEFVDGMEEAISQRNAEVDALVNAALRVRADYAWTAGVSLASAAAMELAIKPFLRVKP
jgi:hypothetical protein